MAPMNALFHQATMRPDATAIIYGDVVRTYVGSSPSIFPTLRHAR
jgi:hypothetical protein